MLKTTQKVRDINLKYRRTKKGVINKIYGDQKFNSTKRGYPLPSYTRLELLELSLATPLFHILFDAWVTSDYEKDLKPSWDRDDDDLPYTFDNLVLMTWEENNRKGCYTRKNGRSTKQTKAVEQFTLDEEYIATYFSMRDASRKTGTPNGGIGQCCNFKAETAGGFKWQYAS